MTNLARKIAVAVLALMGAQAIGCGEKTEAAKGTPPPPPVVYVVPVEKRDLALTTEAVATLDGYVDAEIRARVRGFLEAQQYKDGSAVKAGQLLFSIESDDYAAIVRAGRAGVARAKAADARNRVLLQRSEGLFSTGMVSQQDIDDARAAVADSEGSVQAAQAALDQAQLDLSYTQIRSPIDGIAGVAQVRIGNLVGQDGPTLLTTVSQIDPLRIVFALSEVDYVKYPDRFKHFAGRDLAWAKRQFAKLDTAGTTEDGDPGVELVLSDGRVYGHRAVIVAADRQIDPSTGTIQLQALVPNPDALLRPGQYGRVRISRADEGRGLLVVPQKALIAVQGNYSIGVVGPDDKVDLRRVDLGPTAPGVRAVLKGVKEGERVVVEGVQKISDGAKVKPQPAPPEPAPDIGTSGDDGAGKKGG